MKPSELLFCVVDENTAQGNNDFDQNLADIQRIFFCPVEYWNEHECFPDFNFLDRIDGDCPSGYDGTIGTEETCWNSMKSKEEIVNELSSLGFVHSQELEYFLRTCCG